MSGDVIPAGCIRIDADGVWFYEHAEMSRRDIVRLFYRHLQQDRAGCWFIQIGQQRYSVRVQDTAFVVWALTWAETRNRQGEAALLHLSDDSIEELDPGTLQFTENDVPYCRVKNGAFKARLSQASWYRLAERVEYDSITEAYVLPLNGRIYPIS